MSDQNSFVNAYLNNAISTIHDQTNTILTLKTQLKISQDSLAEKDSNINNLNNQISELNNIITQKDNQISSNAVDINEYNKAIANASLWEQSYNEMTVKVSHMDTLTRQIIEMKNIIKQKDNEIESHKLKNKESSKKKNNIVIKEVNTLTSNTESFSADVPNTNDF